MSATALLLIAAAPLLQARPSLAQDLDFADPRLKVIELRELHVPSLAAPLGTALTPAGHLAVADFATGIVHVVSRDGGEVWARGGKGEGPGEFNALYRVSARTNGDVLAFDIGRHDITVFDSTGAFIERLRLPFRFSQVDQIVAMGDGHVAIAGVTRWGGTASGFGVHVFDAELAHVRSFGPLPAVEQDWVRERWGAGGLTKTPEGHLVYTRRLPYEVYEYTSSGDLLGVIHGPGYFEYGPDDAYFQQVDGGRITTGYSDKPVVRPLTAHKIAHDLFLTGRSSQEEKIWDVLSLDDEPPREMPVPDGIAHLSAIDANRSVLWFVGERDLEPVLIWARVAGPLFP